MVDQFIKRLKKNERGVALLLVMSAIFMLTTVMVEFAFRTNVQYHLALNNADRLQAYYLAESALNFSKLLIKYDKDIQKRIAQANVSVTVEPLYKLFPMNTQLLRAASNGELSGGEAGEETEEETTKTTDTSDTDKGEFNPSIDAENTGDSGVSTGLSILQSDEAKDFLSFPGDFELEVNEVESKYDLNVFYDLASTQPDYDARKRWLADLLTLDPMKTYFEKRDDELTQLDMVYRIVDWVDQNDLVDELGGVSHGSESAAYKDVDYLPKNGKFTSLEEIALVPGMSPGLLATLEPYLTVYNAAHKFNACFADDPLVDALIVMYSETNTCLSPLTVDHDAEKISELRTSFLGGCPKPDEMAKNLDEAFGLVLGEEDASKGTTSTPAKDCGKFKIQDLLTADYKIFELVGRGTVGETTVEIKTVLNTTEDNPDHWPFYYWRVN